MAQVLIKRTVRDKSGKRRTIWIDAMTFKEVKKPDPTALVLNDSNAVEEEVEDINQPDTVKPKPLESPGSDVSPTGKAPTTATQKDSTPTQTKDTPSTQSAPAPSVDSGRYGFSLNDRTRDSAGVMFGGKESPAIDKDGIPTVDPNYQYGDTDTSKPQGVATEASLMTGDYNPNGRSKGFGELLDADRTGLKESYGPETVGPASEDITNAARAAVADAFGPGYTVVATSGERHGGSGNHSLAKGALDFSVTDPQGNRVTDKTSMVELGAALGRQGFQSLGHGKGYMGPGMHHAGAQAAAKSGVHGWGKGGRFANRDLDVYDAFMAERIPGSIGILPGQTTGVPTDNPMKEEGSLIAGMPDPSRDPVGDKSTRAGFSPVDFSRIENDRLSGVDVGNLTPAQAASLGFVDRDNQDFANIGVTLAGELSPTQLAGLQARDPVALQEFANMVATIENRAASSKYESKTLAEVLNPVDYNSLMNDKIATTLDNFGKFQEPIMTAVQDYYGGKLTPSSWSVTNYHNHSVKPDWSTSMKNVANVGGHKFGSLMTPYDYAPGKAFSGWREGLVQTNWNYTPSMGDTRSQTGGYNQNGISQTPSSTDFSGSSPQSGGFMGGQQQSGMGNGGNSPGQSQGFGANSTGMTSGENAGVSGASPSQGNQGSNSSGFSSGLAAGQADYSGTGNGKSGEQL